MELAVAEDSGGELVDLEQSRRPWYVMVNSQSWAGLADLEQSWYFQFNFFLNDEEEGKRGDGESPIMAINALELLLDHQKERWGPSINLWLCIFKWFCFS